MEAILTTIFIIAAAVVSIFYLYIVARIVTSGIIRSISNAKTKED